MHHRVFAFVMLVGGVGCYTPGYGYGYGYGYTPGVSASASAELPAPASIQTRVSSEPQFVAIAPEVSVIVDHEEPIFYSDNFYWRETNGAWYRSTRYDGDWSYYASPPYAVRSLERRDSYRRYRPANYRRDGETRDHRSYSARGYERPRGGNSDHDRGSYDRGSYDRGTYDRGSYDRGNYDRGN